MPSPIENQKSAWLDFAKNAFLLVAGIYWLSLWLMPFPANWIFKFTPMLIAAGVLFRMLESRLAILMAIGFVAAAVGDIFLALMIMVIAASRVEILPGRIYTGALLFFISDALIGIDRFLYSFENALLAIITIYFFAQYLIFTGALETMPRIKDGSTVG